LVGAPLWGTPDRESDDGLRYHHLLANAGASLPLAYATAAFLAFQVHCCAGFAAGNILDCIRPPPDYHH
jgi:hypothetical protein